MNGSKLTTCVDIKQVPLESGTSYLPGFVKFSPTTRVVTVPAMIPTADNKRLVVPALFLRQDSQRECLLTLASCLPHSLLNI